jgi:hypothetical protein
MSGLKNTASRLTNAATGKGYMTNEERRDKKKSKAKAKKDKMFQNASLPDEMEIKRVERRKAANRSSARAQTVLTNRKGLGG